MQQLFHTDFSNFGLRKQEELIVDQKTPYKDYEQSYFLNLIEKNIQQGKKGT